MWRLVWLVTSLIAAGCGGDEQVVAASGSPFDTTQADAGVDATATSDDVSTADTAMPDVAAPDVGVDSALVPPVPDAAIDAGRALTIGERCFADRMPSSGQFEGPNYDQFAPVVGAHCQGTNHQHIYGIEQVVFLGDSVTVGTPPTVSGDFYRTRLADALADTFHLEKPQYLWQTVDPFDGTAVRQTSGSFLSCAKWGARADDLLGGGEQIAKCFPYGGSDQRTLIVMTMGGNDIAAISKAGGAEGQSLTEVRAMTEAAVADFEAAVRWLKDPVRFPNGSFVVFANPFEFTDGTGDTTSCPAANLTDLEPWENPQDLTDLVIWLNEQLMRVAVDTATDMVFMLEHFCGHGYVATGANADPTARCYLGPATPRWFDATCIHPNPVGHDVIAEMFKAVVDEAP